MKLWCWQFCNCRHNTSSLFLCTTSTSQCSRYFPHSSASSPKHYYLLKWEGTVWSSVHSLGCMSKRLPCIMEQAWLCVLESSFLNVCLQQHLPWLPLPNPNNLQQLAQSLKQAGNWDTKTIQYEGINLAEKNVKVSINTFCNVFQLKMVKWIAKLAFEMQGTTLVARVWHSDVYNYKPVILSLLQRHGLFCPVSQKSRVWVSAPLLSLQYRAKSCRL